jgi:hypothetical protein
MKNSVTFVSQIFMGLSVLSIMWLIFGFSLSHGTDSGGFIGNFANVMFNDISYTRCFDGMQVSQASYAAFMMMFAIISPLLMTGGYAERVPFPAFLSVSVLWELFVYYPVSHWVSVIFTSAKEKSDHLLFFFNCSPASTLPIHASFRCGVMVGSPKMALKTLPAELSSTLLRECPALLLATCLVMQICDGKSMTNADNYSNVEAIVDADSDANSDTYNDV